MYKELQGNYVFFYYISGFPLYLKMRISLTFASTLSIPAATCSDLSLRGAQVHHRNHINLCLYNSPVTGSDECR